MNQMFRLAKEGYDLMERYCESHPDDEREMRASLASTRMIF